MRKYVVIVLAILAVLITVLIFLNSSKKNSDFSSNQLRFENYDFKLTTLATFTRVRFLKIKRFGGKTYVLTDNSIMGINGKTLFKFDSIHPYDFAVVDGNYFVSAFSSGKVVTNKGDVPIGVWPATVKVYNSKVYVSTLRSNKIYVINPISCKLEKIIRTPSTPVDFIFVKGKLYVLSGGSGSIFGNGKSIKLDLSLFSIFSDGSYIFAISPKRIYKLDDNLKLLKFIETDYLINYAFFDKYIYVNDTFGYVRIINQNLKEIDFKKLSNYTISMLKQNNDYYLSTITGVYKNDKLMLKSNFIVDLYDDNHILYSDGRVKIGSNVAKIDGAPLKIIFNNGYTYCFTQDGYVYMFDKDANLILKKFIRSSILNVNLLYNKFYITTLGTIFILDKVNLNPIVSKRISILPYKIKVHDGHIYILSVFSRVINEYSQDLSLIKSIPLTKTCYDFYFDGSSLHTDPNLLFSSYIQKYKFLISYDGSTLYLKGKNLFKKISIKLDKIIVTNHIYFLTKTSLMSLEIVKR